MNHLSSTHFFLATILIILSASNVDGVSKVKDRVQLHSSFDDQPAEFFHLPQETLSVGHYHTCAIENRTIGTLTHPSYGGPVKCWGHSEHGQNKPPIGSLYMQISSGHLHTCGINIRGNIECWGGMFNEGKVKVPTGVYTQVSSGEYHSCAVDKAYGKIKCWGRNAFGECDAPTKGRFVQVSSGHYHTCGLKKNGEVECWGGRDHHGESSPPAGVQFRQLSASPYSKHVCGITRDYSVSCWGNNDRYQAENRYEGNYTHVAAGSRSSCAIRSDGSLECWGSNNLIPDEKKLKNIAHVSLGKSHACFIEAKASYDEDHLSNNPVQCWNRGGHSATSHQVPTGFKILHDQVSFLKKMDNMGEL